MVNSIDAAQKLALECGFSRAGLLDVSTIQVRKEVRDTCAGNTCGAYGTRWSCPPACGTLEECEAHLNGYKRGLILQTTGELEDALDGEGMMEISGYHQRHLEAFSARIYDLFPNALLLGAGACNRCKTCGYPDSPCRFPGRMLISMEAMGMVVSDVCKANGLPYYYGPNTMTYVGCVLVE
jgi:predicted metal-binding protein